MSNSPKPLEDSAETPTEGPVNPPTTPVPHSEQLAMPIFKNTPAMAAAQPTKKATSKSASKPKTTSKKSKNTKKKQPPTPLISAPQLLCILVVIGIAGFAGTYAWLHKKHDAKLSAVTSATSAAPAGTASPQADTNQHSTTSQPETTGLYAGWKTYKNDKYGFSFKFPATTEPSNWLLDEQPGRATTDGSDPGVRVELSIVSTNAAARYLQTADISISTDSLKSAQADANNFFDQNKATNVVSTPLQLKGKNAVEYTSLNIYGAPTKEYLIALGNKVFTITTMQEDKNATRFPNYIAVFDKVVDSLTFSK